MDGATGSVDRAAVVSNATLLALHFGVSLESQLCKECVLVFC